MLLLFRATRDVTGTCARKTFSALPANGIRCDSVLSSDFGAFLRKAELHKLRLTALWWLTAAAAPSFLRIELELRRNSYRTVSATIHVQPAIAQQLIGCTRKILMISCIALTICHIIDNMASIP